MLVAQTVLVTGGAGFIGSHLCKQLLDEGLRVVCIDSFITGRKENIKDLASNPRFTLITDDVRNTNVWQLEALADVGAIYDLASPASVDFITTHPVHAATTNSIGLYHALELAKRLHATILFASSSEVYGDPTMHPQKESYWGNVNPVGIRSGYDEGKRFGEALVMAYHRELKLDTRIARIFNTYGPKSSPADGRVIPRFVIAALSGKPIPVHGDGRQTRSFCYVTDMVSGLIALMGSALNQPVNLGNPEEHRIVDIADKIITLTASESRIRYTDRPSDDPSRRKPDIALARRRLGWKPLVSLDEGLSKTITYFKGL